MANITIAQWAAKAEARMDTLVQKVSMEAFREVIERSPVDTGRFRGNWQAAIGSPPTSIEAVGEGYEAVVGRFAPGQVIFLVNNLPYALRLEYGYSDQAPGGMVRLVAQRWQPIVNEAVKQIASGT
jgi:hypothetical protein